jgi:hypothetical protein
MFHLFDLVWVLRNADEHGSDLETQRMIRLAKCERAIRRFYHTGASLSRPDGSNTLQIGLRSGTLGRHDRRLPAARRRVKEQTQNSQHSIKEFFGRRFTL